MEAGGHKPLYALYTATQCLASGYWNHFNKTTGTGEHSRAAPGTATSLLSAHPNRHSHHVTACSANAAFMCYGNYGKYQKPTWKMHMNTPHVVFSTGQLVEYFDG